MSLKPSRVCLRALQCACITTASLLFFGGSAHAASDFKGWLLALDAALAQPAGLDQPLAVASDILAFPPTADRVTMENDADLAWRAAIGYDFGLDMGRLQVSYWTFDNDDSENFTRTGYVAPSLFGYGSYGYMILCNTSFGGCDPTLPVRFTGASGIKASTWDLDYSRTVDVGDRFDLKWLAGLRSASFEEEQSFLGTDETYTYRQDKSLDADAFGIRVGAGGDFHITEHFSLRASLAYSAMIGSAEGKSSQTFVDFGSTESRTGEADQFSGSILDLELKGVWSAGPVDLTLGFTNSEWGGFSRDLAPATGFLFSSESGTDDSFSFASFEVGVLWRIGGSRRLASP